MSAIHLPNLFLLFFFFFLFLLFLFFPSHESQHFNQNSEAAGETLKQ
jgi:hypothetical protein